MRLNSLLLLCVIAFSGTLEAVETARGEVDWTMEVKVGACERSGLLVGNRYRHVLADITPLFTFTETSISGSRNTQNSGNAAVGCYGWRFGGLVGGADPQVVTTLGFYDFAETCDTMRRRAPLVRAAQHSHTIGLYKDTTLMGSCTVTPSSPLFTDSNGREILTCEIASSVTMQYETGVTWAVCATYDSTDSDPCAGATDPIVIVGLFSGGLVKDTRIGNVGGAYVANAGTLDYPATVDLANVNAGPMIFFNVPSASASVTPSATPTPVAVDVAPSRSPQIVGEIQLRLPTQQTSNVTADDIAAAIGGASGTITIVSRTLNTRGMAVTSEFATLNTRAAACLSSPFSETVRVLFSDSADATKLANLVLAGSPAVTSNGLCIASVLATITATAPTGSPATSTVSSSDDNKIAIGVGVGIGVGLPVLAALLLLAWCCLPCGAASRRGPKVAESLPKTASTTNGSTAVNGYTGDNGYSGATSRYNSTPVTSSYYSTSRGGYSPVSESYSGNSGVSGGSGNSGYSA